ncbi:MAG TPA: bacteriophage holin [Acidobacteriota bacterium]|nr:bacteriophage holin [Acidobacteriota bacterium]
MNLQKTALGLSLGMVWGLLVFFATIWATYHGRGATLSVLNSYYIGFSVSYFGAFIGLIWGFVNGFVVGFLIAWLYDLACGLLYKPEAHPR